MPWLPSVIWLVLLVAFAVAEALTVGLVSVWLAAGALAALLSTFFTANIWWQITIFLAVSLLSMAVIRPLARKYVLPQVVPTNADRLVGMEARVTETINNGYPTGAVYADGKTWTARSADGAVIPKGETVEVAAMEGIKLIVRAKAAVPAG